jgi:soluble lytic murein transglycosylase-like protein
MKKRLIAGLLAAAVLGGVSAIPAQAACMNPNSCFKVRNVGADTTSDTTANPVEASQGQSRRLKKTSDTSVALAVPRGSTARGNDVVTLIRSMAPNYGVPTWFALRIAHVESNYKPHVRGAAGEYGVYQLKCSTAKGIGFTGKCSDLLDARTNVKWGLKHLSLAIGKSRGNLKLAASKHNGGLYRRSLVPRYVAKVF